MGHGQVHSEPVMSSSQELEASHDLITESRLRAAPCWSKLTLKDPGLKFIPVRLCTENCPPQHTEPSSWLPRNMVILRPRSSKDETPPPPFAGAHGPNSLESSKKASSSGWRSGEALQEELSQLLDPFVASLGLPQRFLGSQLKRS